MQPGTAPNMQDCQVTQFVALSLRLVGCISVCFKVLCVNLFCSTDAPFGLVHSSA